jgi:UMF1 family MFS transporter
MTSSASPRSRFGWYLYDWANSAYVTTVAAAFLPDYFLKVIAAGVSTPFRPDTMWAWTLSGSAMIAFLLAPVLGAMADFTASRKKFLFAFASVGSLATLLLSLSGPGDVYWTLALFLVAQLCFVSSLVFYDAFLPLVASDEEADAVSAKGYSYGYIGGGIQFSASLALYASHDALGLSETQAARIAILMAGLWWAVFTIISARLLVEPPISLANHASPAPMNLAQRVSIGVSRTRATLHHARRYRHLVIFLLAFMLYNDGIQTVIQMATPFGRDLGITTTMLMLTLLITQILGAPGSMFFSKLAKLLGTKYAIVTSIVLWTAGVVAAYFIESGSGSQFMLLGAGLGFLLGGTQALSRSYYSSMIPPQASAEFFGFFTVFSKFSSIWGTFVFGAATQMGNSTRPAILGTAAFFVLGLVLLTVVDETKARSARQQE